MGSVSRRTVYKPSGMATSLAISGAPPIKTGWSDTSKGDDAEPAGWRRWRAKRRFSLGALRILISLAVTSDGEERSESDPMEMLVLGVRRYHFYAKCANAARRPKVGRMLRRIGPADVPLRDPRRRG